MDSIDIDEKVNCCASPSKLNYTCLIKEEISCMVHDGLYVNAMETARKTDRCDHPCQTPVKSSALVPGAVRIRSLTIENQADLHQHNIAYGATLAHHACS